MFAAVNTCSPIALTISRGSASRYAFSYARFASASTSPGSEVLNASRPIRDRLTACSAARSAYTAADLCATRCADAPVSNTRDIAPDTSGSHDNFFVSSAAFAASDAAAMSASRSFTNGRASRSSRASVPKKHASVAAPASGSSTSAPPKDATARHRRSRMVKYMASAGGAVTGAAAGPPSDRIVPPMELIVESP